PQVLLKIWIKEFLKTVAELKPKFLALHCQEIGGKNYEESMIHVEDFVSTLLESEELQDFTHVKIFLDEDFTSLEKFTALGCLYFIHNSLNNVKLWDFEKQIFVSALGKEIFSGNIELVTTKEKVKFPQDFFPECKWSRKGFIRTRWKLANTVFDLVNIHLFHDASNFLSIESFPSPYTKIRQHALKYTLDKFSEDNYDKYPFFIFGDFNFRLDTGAVIKKLTNNSSPFHIKSAKNGEIEKMVYNDTDSSLLLTLGKKEFDLINQDEIFCGSQNFKWLLEYDKELETFKERLFEFEINFPPSYPFTEDSKSSTYMKTRCPAWCDRVLLSKSAKGFIKTEENDSVVIYRTVGTTVPMGDHKPVLLWFHLDASSGNLMPFQILSSVNEQSCECLLDNDDNNEPHVRLRTHSIPVFRRFPSNHSKARRTISDIPSTQKPPIHKEDWYTKTQELFEKLRSKYSDTKSSRHLSHHSSSSEEWYSSLKSSNGKSNDTNSSTSAPKVLMSQLSETRSVVTVIEVQSNNNEESSLNDRKSVACDNNRVATDGEESNNTSSSTSISIPAPVVCEGIMKESTETVLHSSDISTRYIYVQYGDSPVTVFRETTV
ncbi:type I inositol 1:4:5-trisphosphate 5-phosphatase-like protein, partial [Dinothrombium tinctorium]